MELTFEDLTDLEQVFYRQGHQDGYEHGRVHGLIEGRALGVQKGFEIWEQVAFYGAFARSWLILACRDPDVLGEEKQSRIVRHATQLLDLVSTYPLFNPSHGKSVLGEAEAPTVIPTESQEDPVSSSLDISAIGSKYKVLCATIGCKPRLPLATPALSSYAREGLSRKGDLSEQKSIAQLGLEYEERVGNKDDERKPTWNLNR